jgi:hypothetical protein
MSQKQTKGAKKHTVKEVLASIQWSTENNKLILLSPITDEFVTIELSAIIAKNSGTTQ